MGSTASQSESSKDNGPQIGMSLSTDMCVKKIENTKCSRNISTPIYQTIEGCVMNYIPLYSTEHTHSYTKIKTIGHRDEFFDIGQQKMGVIPF